VGGLRNDRPRQGGHFHLGIALPARNTLIKVLTILPLQDWWLTPELYLRRPPAHYPEWRLDKLLKRKAEQGVKIYVVVYKEVRLSHP